MVRCSSCSCGLVRAYPRYRSFRRFTTIQSWGWKDVREPRLSKAFSDDNLKENILPKLKILQDRGFPAAAGAKLLDIGCGTGAFLKAARDAGFKVTGIEPSWFSSRWARKNLGLDVLTTATEKFRPLAKYDVVTCLHTIEHLANPLKAVERIASFCSKDGIILVATPNLGCEVARRLGADWKAVGPADHLFLFDRDTLEKTLRRAKMEVLEIIETGDENEELVGICRPAS
jgi:2-polyprenyl-3-methyl-5-hydroxy-6-metoxy-1,4-benzoquinol methylase